jgi:hypothetical protein
VTGVTNYVDDVKHDYRKDTLAVVCPPLSNVPGPRVQRHDLRTVDMMFRTTR